ncbi:MAG TPA: TrmO family methyltransferase [Candidatus Bathyarchaeia archaeon]|nr:TrmO family methyltransferase [Candidatus Bathyarchaeia archaeon]
MKITLHNKVRAPNRPNAIGLSIVKLEEINAKKTYIEIVFSGVDMLDETPLLDIKPYIIDFDSYPEAKCGLYDKREIKDIKTDNRFSEL